LDWKSNYQEHMGYVFVKAVAYSAGYSCSLPEVDDDSIDVGIFGLRGTGPVRGPRLEIQVKTLVREPLTTDGFSYPLKLKNYDDLRDEHVFVPRILAVVLIDEPKTCVSVTDEKMTVHHAAYWAALRGLPDVIFNANAKNPRVPVRIERANRFDQQALMAMMNRISERALP
jgi:hypothetical protein